MEVEDVEETSISIKKPKTDSKKKNDKKEKKERRDSTTIARSQSDSDVATNLTMYSEDNPNSDPSLGVDSSSTDSSPNSIKSEGHKPNSEKTRKRSNSKGNNNSNANPNSSDKIILPAIAQKILLLNLEKPGSLVPVVTANEATKHFFKSLNVNSSKTNIKDADGNSPLHWAALLGQLEVVRILLRRGAKPSEKKFKRNHSFALCCIKNFITSCSLC